MFKQFSVHQKIFGTTTLLLGMCYVGFLIYVQPAFAVKPIWLWYDAEVWNIRAVGHKWRNHTQHRVRYDHTASNVDEDVGIRTIAKWVKNDNQTWESNPQDTQETCLAGTVGTILITRQLDQDITGPPDEWKAQAYTNLLSKGEWLDGQDDVGATFAQTEEVTLEFFPPTHPVLSPRVENRDQQ